MSDVVVLLCFGMCVEWAKNLLRAYTLLASENGTVVPGRRARVTADVNRIQMREKILAGGERFQYYFLCLKVVDDTQYFIILFAVLRGDSNIQYYDVSLFYYLPETFWKGEYSVTLTSALAQTL